MIVLCALLTLLALALFPSLTLAADWPRWRGPDNTGYVPAGEAVPATLPSNPKLLWQVKLGEGVGSPVVAGGRVFCLDNRDEKETLCAFDLASGKELWHAAIDEVITDGIGTGPRGTPVVDGPRVYAQSCRGEFRCFNTADGKPLWKVNFVKDYDAEFLGEVGPAQARAATDTPGRRWWTASGSSLESAAGTARASSLSTRPMATSSGNRRTTCRPMPARSSRHWPAHGKSCRSPRPASSDWTRPTASCFGAPR